MVTENPPHRSKSRKKPVTLDLTAETEAAETVAEPVRSNDSDDTITDTAPGEASPVEDHAIEEDKPGKTEETPQTAETVTRPEPNRQGPAISTLIAAGIFGGIVALALAGSMQYAGYLPGTTPAAETTDISSELADLRQEIGTLRQAPSPVADPELRARLDAVEAALAEATRNGATQNSSDDTAPRFAALEQQLSSLQSTAEAEAAATADLTRRLEAAEARLNEPGEEVAVARAIAAAALKSAIDRGGAFATELETFAGVAADDPALAPLRSFSAKGVPSRAELVEAFPGTANAILAALNQPDPDQGIADRLMASALSVVKVRRIGDVEGDTPEAVVARMENALKSGDLQASARTWETLPEAGKAASVDFKQSLDARIQVEALVGETLNRAVSDTGIQD